MNLEATPESTIVLSWEQS